MATSPESQKTTLILSIIACMPQEKMRSVAARRELASAASWLAGKLKQRTLQATWFSGEPAAAARGELAAVDMSGNELGLLADASWSNTTTTRAHFAAELTRRLLIARSAGISVATLAIPGSSVPHPDLVYRQAIRAVASFPRETQPRRENLVQSPFFGLWQSPVDTVLPHTGFRRLRLAARQWLRRGAGSHPLLHAGIDLHLICQGGATARRSLEQWLSAVVRLSEQERCRVSTLNDAFAEYGAPRQTPSSRSILRAA